MAIYEKEAGVQYDELFAGPEKEVLTANLTIAAGAAMKRGTLLALDEETGKAAAVAKGGTATHILARDVDQADADSVVTTYASGRFNRSKLIVAEGDTVEAHEEQLRMRGIYLGAII